MDLVLEASFLTTEFLGIQDSDSPLVAPILPESLFKWEGGVWKPRMLIYNGMGTGWEAGTKFLFGGAVAPIGEAMVVIAFPTVVKAQHLKSMRELIVTKVLGVQLVEDKAFGGLFEQCFWKLLDSGLAFSQQDIITSYLFQFHRDEYSWVIRDQMVAHHPSFSGRMTQQPEVIAMHESPGALYVGHSKHGCLTWSPYFQRFVCLASQGTWPGCDEGPPLDTSEKDWMLQELFVDWSHPFHPDRDVVSASDKETPPLGWREQGTEYLLKAARCTQANYASVRNYSSWKPEHMLA